MNLSPDDVISYEKRQRFRQIALFIEGVYKN